MMFVAAPSPGITRVGRLVAQPPSPAANSRDIRWSDVHHLQQRASQSLNAANQVQSKGFLSSRTLTTRETLNQTNALGSSLSGQTVNIQSGQDIVVSGSSVVSDQGTEIQAGRKLTIEAAQETYQKDSYRQTTKSGLFSGGGLAVTIGTQQQSLDQQNTGTQSAASTIGAVSGNVNLSAAQTYTQTGSDVLAPGGDINISAQDVQITEARDTQHQSTEQKFKQSGLTLAITSPVISALQGMQQTAQAMGNTSNSRMQALGAATLALQGQALADQASKIDKALGEGKDPTDATGINLSISIGASSSQSTQTQDSDSARGSTLTAGGNIHIQASGAGADSNLLIRGSTVNAAGNVSLQAEGDVTLQAAANTSEDHSSNSSRSGSIGVSIGTDGFGITASASRGKGQGEGAETTYSNTHVSGASVNIQSGADTTLQGAVVQGEQVSVNAGGNLHIQSLQDSASYKERSSSVGGSITVGAGFSGSINASKTKIDSDYLSVTEQSGIRAGDGGFQVAVAGDTTLTGGAITSSDAAVNDNLNRFSTGGTLTTSDLSNSASYNASSASIGIGTTGGSAGIGSDKGSAASTTQAAISGIAGNTDARTGDAETGINAIFDKERVKQEVNAQVQITQAFGQQASNAWGDYTDKRMREAQASGDKEEAAKWAEGGIYRAAGHTVIGGLGGGASGALGAGLSSTAAPLLNDLQSQLQAGLEKTGLPTDVAKGLAGLASGATVAALGNAAGGSAGAMGAFNQDANNRQLHPTEIQKAKELAAKSGGKYTQQQIEDALRSAGNTATGESVIAGMVVDPKDAQAIYDKGAVWTLGENGQLVQVLPPQPDAELKAFIQQNSGSTYAWYTPAATVPTPTGGASRDRLTGLPLDDKGRYSQTVVLDGKVYEPKYLPCASTECMRTASNLDMSDPATKAYVKALDQQVFKDIGTGATAGTLVVPLGIPGATLGVLGLLASGGQAATSDTSYMTGFDEFLKATSEKGGAEFFEKVLGHTPGAAARFTALINLSGGWDAFVQRVKVDLFGMQANDAKK